MSNYHRGQKLLVLTPTGEFTQIPNIILTLKGLTATEKLVLIYVHRYANIKSWVFYYSKIAEDLGLDESGVRRSWKGLERKRLIANGAVSYATAERMQKIEPGKNPDSSTGKKSKTNRENFPIEPGKNPAYKEEYKQLIETDRNKEMNREKIPVQLTVPVSPTPLGATATVTSIDDFLKMFNEKQLTFIANTDVVNFGYRYEDLINNSQLQSEIYHYIRITYKKPQSEETNVTEVTKVQSIKADVPTDIEVKYDNLCF